MVEVTGFEPVTLCLQSRRSTWLSYTPKSRVWLVGMAGFEPAASSSRTRRAAKLRHIPLCVVVEVTGFEPVAFCVPRRCSTWLSYTPRLRVWLVGMAGFEPATPCSQSRCSS